MGMVIKCVPVCIFTFHLLLQTTWFSQSTAKLFGGGNIPSKLELAFEKIS